MSNFSKFIYKFKAILMKTLPVILIDSDKWILQLFGKVIIFYNVINNYNVRGQKQC